ncbi:hypothetical protein BOX15_Mlig016240g2 [Macrostomum lignano]|uniref:Uncharacterized protein n=1 Tax=Macrostomum lignano TaxID=282301 RepID=A0A267E836_9PLAT|nr:hypothetical protein BOX15_Mlig016240g2 [Macrostomum lignano]
MRQGTALQPLPTHRARQRRCLSHLESRLLPPADGASRGLEIRVEFLVARPRRWRRPRSSQIQRRQLIVHSQFPLPQADKQPGRSEGGSLVRQFLEATLVQVKTGCRTRRRSQVPTSGTENPRKSPASKETQRKIETAVYPAIATRAGWPRFAAEDAQPPDLDQACCHLGQRPVISRSILGSDLAGRFATQHRLVVPGAICGERPPQLSQQFCQALQLSAPRLPSVDEAAAVRLPGEVVELNSCGLRQIAGLPGSTARRWASHRLLPGRPGSARIAATCRFGAQTVAVAIRFGPMTPAFAEIKKPQVSKAAAAGRRFCYAASHCLRLSVRPVADLGIRRLHPLRPDGRHRGELAMASASAATIHFGRIFTANPSWQLEAQKRPGGQAAVLFSGDVGGDASGFDDSKKAPSDASGDRRLSAGSAGPRWQGNNSNTNDSESQGTSRNSGCWDYVYLKSEKEEMRLVELHDTQERCSTVSTVMGIVGFKAPIFLAVPNHLLPARAIPVICGNVIELGDWDVNCSEPMAHTAQLMAPGYAFFEASVCSNYSDEEEVEFRFAIVVPAPGSDCPAKSELFAWEGGFVRRMSDYNRHPDGFLLFGRPDQLLDPRDLLELPAGPPARSKSVWPGWLTDVGQAMLLLRLRPPLLQPDRTSLLHRPLGVELSAKDASGATLTPNLRGPLLLEGAELYSPLPPPPPPPPPSTVKSSPLSSLDGVECSCSSDDMDDDGSGINWVRLASAASARVEFAQQVPLGGPVTCRFLLRFHDTGTNSCDRGTCVEAVALLPLTVDLATPEKQTVTCDLLLTASSQQHIGQLTVDIGVAHCFQHSPLDLARFVDRCGATAPLQDPAPILVLPMPATWLLPMGPDTWSAATAAFAAVTPTSRYFELPVGVSQSGVLRLLRADGAKSSGQAQDGDLCLAFPPDARLVVRVVLDDSAQVNRGADALLASLLPASERCVLVAAHDLQLCLALSLKQSRLSLAFFAASVSEAAAALDICRHFGLRAVAVPAEQLFDDRPDGRALADAARVCGVALYAYGGCGGAYDAGQAATFHLEGVFGSGTVVGTAH